jgi:hypothetical protein
MALNNGPVQVRKRDVVWREIANIPTYQHMYDTFKSVLQTWFRCESLGLLTTNLMCMEYTLQ